MVIPSPCCMFRAAYTICAAAHPHPTHNLCFYSVLWRREMRCRKLVCEIPGRIVGGARIVWKVWIKVEQKHVSSAVKTCYVRMARLMIIQKKKKNPEKMCKWMRGKKCFYIFFFFYPWICGMSKARLAWIGKYKSTFKLCQFFFVYILLRECLCECVREKGGWRHFMLLTSRITINPLVSSTVKRERESENEWVWCT